MEEYKLDNPPSDCISCLRYSKTENCLLVSSWDTTVSLYDTLKSKLLNRFYNSAAVLACDIINHDSCCLGGLDCTVKIYDFQKKHERILGYHNAAISSILYIESLDWVISGSWDKIVKVWDLKSTEQKPLYELTQQSKVYAMDVSTDLKLLVACDNRQISCYDLHSLPTAIFTRDSILKYSIRCIHFLSDNNGYIVGSIEGRVGVEYITETETCKPFSFRCHRKSDTYNEYVYPVNAIAVHPQYGTFATGGADGTVCIWDSVAKKRLAIFSNYTPGVSALAFNPEGNHLAIAFSYTFEQGPLTTEYPNGVSIRSIKTEDVKPSNKVLDVCFERIILLKQTRRTKYNHFCLNKL